MGHARAIQPVPIALPGLRVLSYGSSTAVPIGLSLDRKTWYGATQGGGSVLYQSTNDMASWTSVRTFPNSEKVLGIFEHDDGEVTVCTQSAASEPGYLYRSSGWAASHTSATWTLRLTTIGGYIHAGFSLHSASFGNNSVRAGSSLKGITNEYGTQTTSSGDQTAKARRAYITTDGGITWTQAFDLLARWPGANPMHLHASLYDPWADNFVLTFGDTQAGTPATDFLVSSNQGATWSAMPVPTEWAGKPLQSTAMTVDERGLWVTSDNEPGIIHFSRTGTGGYGNPQAVSVGAGGSGSGLVGYAAHRNRAQPGAPILLSYASVDANVVPAIYIIDDLTVSPLWWDDSLAVSFGYYGPNAVFGPSVSGVIGALVNKSGSGSNSAALLRGELVACDPNMFDIYLNAAGNGSQTVFNIPHPMGTTPTKFDAWAMSQAATATFTLTATSSNVVATFSVAPTNGASIVLSGRCS